MWFFVYPFSPTPLLCSGVTGLAKIVVWSFRDNGWWGIYSGWIIYKDKQASEFEVNLLCWIGGACDDHFQHLNFSHISVSIQEICSHLTQKVPPTDCFLDVPSLASSSSFQSRIRGVPATTRYRKCSSLTNWKRRRVFSPLT